MFWNRKPKYALDDIEAILDIAFDCAQSMYDEARKVNMVEMGLLPQGHLSRDDLLKNRHRLEQEGHTRLRGHSAEAGTPDDADLLARDD